MSSWIGLLLVVPLLVLMAVGAWTFISLLQAVRAKGNRDFNTRCKPRLPPGPPRLPILGNLHMLGARPHQDLRRLAMDYGPIMYMRLGLVPTVVVSSSHFAKKFLKTHDVFFASRPFTEAGEYLSYRSKGVAFSVYGPHWRSIRKWCTIELLSNAKTDSFKSLRREEVGVLVQSLKDIAEAHAEADLSSMLGSHSASVTCRMVLGNKHVDGDLDVKGISEIVHEGMKLTGAFNISDFIPCVASLDLQGLRRRMKGFHKVMDDLLEKIIDEHARAGVRGQHMDFVDALLSLMDSKDAEFQVTRANIKAVVLDMLTGAMDTSSTVIEWAVSELLRHPRVMKKLQQELERAVGNERMVEESDLTNLEYLEMVVKETLRLHPAAPLLVPHESIEECTIDGFYVPKRCRVIVNAWAIGRDPAVWSNAEEFYPERFKGSNIDVKGQHFQLIPFGSGRRSCPGMHLGLTLFRLVLAQLVHCFDWELPNGMCPTDLDMHETFSLVVRRANNISAVPTYRLKNVRK